MSEFKMKFDGQQMLEKLNKLDEIKSMKDVKNITHTQYPGTHCPLMGALLVTRGISDSMAFIVGTDECVYYSKSMTLNFDGFGGLHGRCVSMCLDTNDVTFGSVEKVEDAFDEMMEEYTPTCVFLISTCIIEIIGDDFDALALRLSKKYNLPVLPIHTEHFKAEDHLPGIERALTACATLMEKQECDNSVNILGQRFGEFDKTELSKVLKEENISLNSQLPMECSLADIKIAPKAKVNVVVNTTALELAKKMEELFNIPYVVFDKYASYESNFRAYSKLFTALEKPVPQSVIDKCEELKNKFIEKKTKYKGLTYIYGNAPFVPFEHIRLMSEFGLKPLVLQVSAIDENYKDDIKAIIENYNPYVTRTANVSGLMHVYDTLQPDLNFGAAYPQILQEKKIVPVRFENSADMLGFEMSDLFLASLDRAKEEVVKIRNV